MVGSDHDYDNPGPSTSRKEFIAFSVGQNSGVVTWDEVLKWATTALNKSNRESVVIAKVFANVRYEYPPVKVDYV